METGLVLHPVNRDAWGSVVVPVQTGQPLRLVLGERHCLQLLLQAEEALLRRVGVDEGIAVLYYQLGAAPVLRQQLQQRRFQAAGAAGRLAALRRSGVDLLPAQAIRLKTTPQDPNAVTDGICCAYDGDHPPSRLAFGLRVHSERRPVQRRVDPLDRARSALDEGHGGRPAGRVVRRQAEGRLTSLQDSHRARDAGDDDVPAAAVLLELLQKKLLVVGVQLPVREQRELKAAHRRVLSQALEEGALSSLVERRAEQPGGRGGVRADHIALGHGVCFPAFPVAEIDSAGPGLGRRWQVAAGKAATM